MDYLGQGRDAKEDGDLESTKLGGALQQRSRHAFGNHSYSSVIAGVCEKQDYSAVSEESGIQLPVPFTKSTEASMPLNKRERKLNRRFIIITSVIVIFVLSCLIGLTVYFITKASTSEFPTTDDFKASTREVSTADDLITSTSDVSKADDFKTSTRAVSKENDFKGSTSEVSTANDFKTSTSEVSTVDDFEASTRAVSKENDFKGSTSEVSTANDFKTSTSEFPTTDDFKVQCPSNYTKYKSETCGRFCYRYESNECQSWFDARQTCQNEGSDLMVPSECSYPFFREQASLNEGGCSHFWIGGRLQTPGANYVTVKGDVIPQDSSFSYWSTGQPDNLGAENCLEMRSYFNNYLMNNYYCEVKEGFICQFFLNNVVY